jgi:hypothetical protein
VDLAPLIPITAILMGGLFAIARGQLGQALAHRLRGGASVDAAALQAQLDEVREQLELLRGEVGETQERLDFAERLLTRGRENQQPMA